MKYEVNNETCLSLFIKICKEYTFLSEKDSVPT